ncbi:hypothetical protein VTL71DRAFT_5228 [Oculimacula yallundae]|uniref:CBM-cenC domain-containing protein n=1 Tax=Oculimacula yallundae TaxID=86028 RepID=A0ABR4C0H9_9HELO
MSSSSSTVFSTTSSVEPTSSTVISSTTSSAVSSSSSTISSSTTSSATPSASPPPRACLTPLRDSGFEETNAALIPWMIRSNPGNLFTIDFQSIATTPKSGSQVLAMTKFNNNLAISTILINQPITVCPNTVYTFSAYTASINHPCSVDFLMASADGNVGLAIIGRQTLIGTSSDWVQVTGTYMTTSTEQLSFYVRHTCPGNAPGTRAIYVDDIVLTGV